MSQEQKQVILLIKENPIITTNQIANQLNLSQRQILRHIKINNSWNHQA
ncbi:MAG: winged helix-turn-helix transcriptional regulator [Butyricimonas paravirosa]